jgi:basic membrane protein A
MKKVLVLFVALTTVFLTGCTEAVDYSEDIATLETEIATLKQTIQDLEADIEELQNVPEVVELKVAMITDSGTIDDESFNQGTWEGIVSYCKANGHEYQYYKPTEVSDTAYLAAIQLAVLDGADVVVTPGFLFETSVYAAQTLYPDVNFILIDGVPHNGLWGDPAHDFTTEDNTLSILFNEHESGFLAGYAAVMDGYRHLGFTGGMAVPAVVKFGVGFVAGAYYAAEELDVTITLGDDDYHYFGDFGPSDTFKAYAAGRYTAGTEVIFSAAGGAGGSVMAAAEEAGGGAAVIGVDVDQYYLSDTVITSALKGLGAAVETALEDIVNGTFEGGQSIMLGAADGGVGLPMENSLFSTFTEADYLDILADIADGTVVVPASHAELVTFLTANGNPSGYPAAGVVEPAN